MNALSLFSKLQIKDVADMAVVALLVYVFLTLLKRTYSYRIVGGIVIFFGLFQIASIFHFTVTTLIFRYVSTFIIVLIIVIFQRELRNFFEWLFLLGRWRGIRRTSVAGTVIEEIVEASRMLAEQHIGALLVFPGVQPLDRFLTGGITLQGKLSGPLLLSIFDTSSPGHDGAVIIEGDQVIRFGVHLPLAEHLGPRKRIGTRHRAALGLSQNTDAAVIVISEEQGTISLAHEGEMTTLARPEELRIALNGLLADEIEARGRAPWHAWITHNGREKLVAIGVAIFLWISLR